MGAHAFGKGLVPPPKFRKRVVVIATLAVYLLIEGLSFAGLYLLDLRGLFYDPRPTSLNDRQKDTLSQFLSAHGTGIGADPDLGWIRSFTSTPAYFRALVETNSAGMRDDQDYAPFPAPGITRIAAFGDSFTYGSDVPLNKCWAKLMAAKEPRVEVLNYGVGAYGLDQAYLRYLKVGMNDHPNIVFIGYMTGNFARDVNVFNSFYIAGYRDWIVSKPRFELLNGELTLLKNPLSSVADFERFERNPAQVLAELGRHDYQYQTGYDRGPLDFLPSFRLAKIFWSTVQRRLLYPHYHLDGTYNAKSEAYQVTEKIFDAFYRKVLADGALPIIVILPNDTDQRRSRDRKPRRYQPLVDHLNAEHDRFVDLLRAFQPYEPRRPFTDLVALHGHYTPLGNRIVADYLLEQLKNLDLLDPSRVTAAVARERQRLE